MNIKIIILENIKTKVLVIDIWLYATGTPSKEWGNS